MKAKRIKLFCLLLVAMVGAAPFVLNGKAADGASGGAFRKVLQVQTRLAPRAVRSYPLRGLDPARTYSLSVSLPTPESLSSNDSLSISLRDHEKTLATKILHEGDPDLYVTFRPLSPSAELTVSSTASFAVVNDVAVLEWPESKSKAIAIESEPNDSWREANEFSLGQTVWSTADDKPYITRERDQTAHGTLPYQNVEAKSANSGRDVLPEGGVDWFKFTFTGDRPQLVYFEVDLLERDNIPVDVSVYTIEQNEAKVYEKGVDPSEPSP